MQLLAHSLPCELERNTKNKKATQQWGKKIQNLTYIQVYF